MPYEFRILGPVGLEQDGAAVRLGPPKRRAIVAALLLEPNQSLSWSQLTKAMWPDPAPRSARNNLRTHVSALRKVLGCRLRFQDGGYELRVEPAELDAAEFAKLAAAGQAALAGGQLMLALTQLGRALALWRGHAGHGVPRGTWLDARFVYLDQQRLEVFENHVAARLHTRDFSQIAADLRQHLTSWPTRERCWELLMLAHYRSGDVPAALAAYRQAREVLVEQVGMEPGPELQRLHRAVLQRDPALDEQPPRETAILADPEPPDQAGAAEQPAPPPGQAPPAAQRVPRPEWVPVVGRADEQRALAAALREHPPAVVICGPAGVGKSALAGEAATAVADTYPDGRVTVELPVGNGTAPPGAAEVLGNVRRALADIPPEPVPRTVRELAAAYHALVGGRRVLVVLDGATDAGQVRPLLSDTGPTVLVTSRCRRLVLAGAPRLEVDPLVGQRAVDLLTEYAGAVRTGDEPESVRELVRICDGLPLALRIAGEWLARRPDLPVGLLVTHLARRPLDGLRAGELSMRDALAADLQAVAADHPLAARLFPLLANGDVHSPETLARQLDEDASLVFFALERLVDQWLVSPPEPGCYHATGLRRTYAAELASRGLLPPAPSPPRIPSRVSLHQSARVAGEADGARASEQSTRRNRA